jgi:hypothetical protein
MHVQGRITRLNGWSPKASDEEILIELMASLTGGKVPKLDRLIAYLRSDGRLSPALLRWLLAALKRDSRLPFHLVFWKRQGNPGDPELLDRHRQLYERVIALRQIIVTEDVCSLFAKKYFWAERRSKIVKGRRIFFFDYPDRWHHELKFELGRKMRLDDAILIAASECSFKFEVAQDLFYEFRKATNAE